MLLAAHEKAGATNYEDAVKFASDFFRTAGIADGDVVLSDGSGLSRKDLVTPRAIVQLLRYAAKRSPGASCIVPRSPWPAKTARSPNA